MNQKIAELLGEAGMKYPWIEKLDLVRLNDFTNAIRSC